MHLGGLIIEWQGRPKMLKTVTFIVAFDRALVNIICFIRKHINGYFFRMMVLLRVFLRLSGFHFGLLKIICLLVPLFLRAVNCI